MFISDYVNLLCASFQPKNIPDLDLQAQEKLYRVFVRLVYDSASVHFSSGDVLDQLEPLVNGELWEKWLSYVENKQGGSLYYTHSMIDWTDYHTVSANESGRLSSLIKPDLTARLDQLGSLNIQEASSSSSTKHRDGSNNLATIRSYLLIAAYLASYNPSRTDVRMLAVAAEEELSFNKKKKTRKAKPVRSLAKVSSLLPSQLTRWLNVRQREKEMPVD